MSDIIGWKIWYNDDSVYSSASNRWEDLPEEGVLIVQVYYEDEPNLLLQGTDFYYETDEPSYESGMNEDLIYAAYPSAKIKKGGWIHPKVRYREILLGAIDEKWED